MAISYHNPVLLTESINLLAPEQGGLFVDATFGGGGHSKEILQRLESGMLFAFDKDAEAIGNRINHEKFGLIRSDFRFIEMRLAEKEVNAVDGILADLGISSRHIDSPQRGFSFREDGPLDMRMDDQNPITAATIVNEWDQQDIESILRQFGELRNAKKLAAAIAEHRKEERIETTAQLANLIDRATAAKNSKKVQTLVFQALRIQVNEELEALKDLLEQGLRLLKPGGRFVIISYHSLEDRLVKNFFRYGNLDGIDHRDEFGRSLTPFELINRKVIKPSEEEIEENPRSRSARLRGAKKKDSHE